MGIVGTREGGRGRKRGRERVGSEGKGREGMEKERDGKGRQGAKGGERVEKGEEGLDLDICPGAPEFLVTPLP